MRLLSALLLTVWLTGGLFLTLAPANAAPGQVVDDNLVPFHTLRIYAANLDSWFWMRNALGNLAFLLPIGLVGPIALPSLGRWWRVALAALLLSGGIELAQLGIADRSADVDDVIVNVLGALLGFAALVVIRWGPRAAS